MTYNELLSQVSSLIREMEGTTKQDPDDPEVEAFRKRLFDLTVKFDLELTESLGLTGDDLLEWRDNLKSEGIEFCEICGLKPDDCYAGCQHVFFCDRLFDPNQCNPEYCADEACVICNRERDLVSKMVDTKLPF